MAVHCHSPAGGVLARLAAHKRGIRAIYTAHGFHFYQKAPLKNWLLYYPAEKLLARWTDVLVTVNREDYCFARRYLGAGRVCYLPGVGVDTELFGQQASDAEKREFRLTYGLPQDAAVLLSVGELSGRKNHRLALEAVRRLSAAGELFGQKVCYLICGQGPKQKELVCQAKALEIADDVRLAGYQEDVRTFYQNADIFVFPSIQEGLPVALMEAMASGLPCVVSDIRGNRELIRRKFRFPLDTGAPQEMAGRLALLIRDPRLRREEGRRNQKKVQRYDREAVQKKMFAIYQSMEGCKNKKRTGQGKPEQAPEISVIMGTCNDNRAYAAQAIDSILGQTFPSLELIICDDGSEPSYFSWLRDYCKKDLSAAQSQKPGPGGCAEPLSALCVRIIYRTYGCRRSCKGRPVSKAGGIFRQAPGICVCRLQRKADCRAWAMGRAQAQTAARAAFFFKHITVYPSGSDVPAGDAGGMRRVSGVQKSAACGGLRAVYAPVCRRAAGV